MKPGVAVRCVDARPTSTTTQHNGRFVRVRAGLLARLFVCLLGLACSLVCLFVCLGLLACLLVCLFARACLLACSGGFIRLRSATPACRSRLLVYVFASPLARPFFVFVCLSEYSVARVLWSRLGAKLFVSAVGVPPVWAVDKLHANGIPVSTRPPWGAHSMAHSSAPFKYPWEYASSTPGSTP